MTTSTSASAGPIDQQLVERLITELLTQLGKHKGGLDSCLYVNKLADIDLDVLEKVIKLGVSTLKKTAAEKNWPVSAS